MTDYKAIPKGTAIDITLSYGEIDLALQGNEGYVIGESICDVAHTSKTGEVVDVHYDRAIAIQYYVDTINTKTESLAASNRYIRQHGFNVYVLSVIISMLSDTEHSLTDHVQLQFILNWCDEFLNEHTILDMRAHQL